MSRFVKSVIFSLLATVACLWATDVTVNISNSGDDFVEIYMENTEPVGGFQFVLSDDPDAFTVTGASGGSAQDAGYMMSTNADGMVLGFSLQGTTIPVGSGVLTTIAIDAFGDNSQLTLIDIIFSDPFGVALSNEFVQDGGFYQWGDAPPEDMCHLSLIDGEADAGETGTMEILLENTMEIGGFQFVLVDNPDLITLTSVATTDRTADADFMLSSNEGGMILGFSLSGGTIDPGEGAIVIATYTAGAEGGIADVDYTDVIISDPVGIAIESTNESGTFTVIPGYVPPAITILSPEEGDLIFGENVDVSVMGENMIEGDHYHAYLDGALQGMFYADDFTLTDVAFGDHVLIVTIADETHTDYDNPEATATVNFVTSDQPLEGYTISIGTETVLAEETVDVDLSLANEGVVAGFQFKLVDFPNYADIVGVEVTDRTSAFLVQFNEQEDGTCLIVGFDMNLVGIAPGTGPILTLTYLSTGIYDAELELSLAMGESILSDLIGNPIYFETETGLLIVDGMEPPPLFAPENVVAIGGWEMVSLSWTHPEPWDVVGYYIYRDGVMVGESGITNYADSGLEAGVTYCYTVAAYNDFVVSEFSAEVCAETMTAFFEPPQELTAEENGLEITLEWELPEGQQNIGGPCEGCAAPPCIFDCQWQCVDEATVNMWLGDGLCDDGSWGIYLDCEEFNWDNGDCPEGVLNDDFDPDAKEYYQCDGPQNTRDLIGYEIFRDNVMLEFTTETEYVDTDDVLWYLETYCYNVTAVYDEGVSGFSNTACATPQLGEPSGLSAHGEGDYIALEWDAHPDDAQTSFYIYRDGEFLTETVETDYADTETTHDVEYCYYVTAYYEGIGESPATDEVCNMWSLCPPSYLAVAPGDGHLDVTWDETSCGEEVFLQYDDGILANGFYFYDSYEMGFAHGTRFDVGTDFDVLAASLYILSEGDAYWPWPDGTHGPVDVLVFDDNNGLPGNLLYQESTIAEDGWATVYPNLTGMSGAFHVIASHDEGWTDPEGFGVDGGVDHPDNMVTMQSGSWSTGDVLGYGGDYMIAGLINAYGQIMPMSYSNLPSDLFTDMSQVANVSYDPNAVLNDIPSHPSYSNTLTRELLSYDLFKDGDFLINVEPDVFAYQDNDVVNMQEYCYHMTANYTEGASNPTDPVCEIPIPGNPPTELTAEDMGGTIHLDWTEPIPFEGPVEHYNVYRNGEFYDAAADTEYDDLEPTAGVEYCYTVTAVYDSGESFESNEACSVYYLDPPVGLYANGLDEEMAIQLTWYPPMTNLCADELIDDLPFYAVGSNAGESDDWLVQGSQGADYAYSLTVSDPLVVDFTVCDEATTFDTKIEVFTADFDCNETTTGYYNDDATCTYSSLQSTLTGVALDAGTYYFVVDGYSGQEGTFGISITESGFTAQEPPMLADLIAIESEKLGYEIAIEDWTIADGSDNMLNRELLGYNIYRDDEYLDFTEADVLEYLDEYPSAVNDVEYCYFIRTLYEDGESVPSNTSCAQWRLPAPSELTVTTVGSTLELDWIGAPGGAIEYIIYRDGEFFDSTTETNFVDTTPIHDVLYCYEVRAVHDLGESGPTNEACGMWMILPPAALIAEAGPPNVAPNEVYLTWQPPGSEVELFIEIQTDFWGYETTWDIVDANGTMVESMNDALDNETYYSWIVTLSPGTYTFTIYDSYGDGIYSPGYYRLSIGDNIVAENLNFSGSQESVTFNTNDFLLSIVNNSYAIDMPYEKGTELTPEMIAEIPMADPVVIYERDDYRPLESYNLFRDGDLVVNLPPEVQEYTDTGLTNLIEYCYTITSVFTEGESPESNEACATPLPGNPPLDLSAQGEGDYILLNWSVPELTAAEVMFYTIYRDGEELTTLDELTYEDSDAVHDVEYCYEITAMYPAGESFPSNTACDMWELCPPSNVEATPGDRFVDLTWEETACGEEVFMQYDDGVLANGFYFYDSYEMGFAHGTRFDVGSNFDVLAASLYILSEGDEYWPWPDGTHGPVDVLVFDDNNGLPGNLLHQESATAEDGWATIYPNITGLSGAFHVIASHDAGWTDLEGFGVDGGVDYPDNMVTMQSGSWSTGDVLGYGGDYMIAALINARGTIQPMSFGDLPSDPVIDMSVVNSVHDGSLEVDGGVENHPPYMPEVTRELLDYSIYRDEAMIATIEPDVYAYHDDGTDIGGLVNWTEYCYTMVANYTEGPSQETDPVCATPYPCDPPTELEALAMLGIHLDWVDAPCEGLIEYIIYRDGQFYDSSPVNSYDDANTEPGVEYCYTVSGIYDGGETAQSNESCAMWDVDPTNVTATGMDDQQAILVQWTVPTSEADFMVEILTDNYGGETSWDLMAEDGTMIEQMTGGLSSTTLYTWEYVLEAGTYIWTIYDSFGDGICCSWGEGYYNLYVNDNVIATGGEFGSQESVTFNTSDGALLIAQNYYEIDVPYEKGTQLTPEQIADLPVGEPTIVFENEPTRLLQHYLLYRDDELHATVDPDVLEYWDYYPDAQNDTEYCYYVVCEYDEGLSEASNTACAAWNLAPPTELTAEASGSDIQLTWVGTGDPNVLMYFIYRDGVFYMETTETSFLDVGLTNDVEFCYYVTAFYDIGESGATEEECAMWQLCPPGYLATDPGDGYIDVTWDEVSCGEEVYLQYDDGILANGFYFYDSYEMGFAHGTRFDVGTDFDVLAASLYILSEGDEYWPWPDGTHGPVDVLVFDDNNGLPGNLLYQETTVSEDGWATVYPNLTGMSGAFHVVASHDAGWTDLEGFGVDGGVDHPDNMVTMQSGTWSTGDVLGYGGDYMTAGLINAYGQVMPMGYTDLPTNPFENFDAVASIPEGTPSNGVSEESHPSYNLDNGMTRELISYELYRDGTFVETFTPDVFGYHDEPLNNMQEYCYTMQATYTEGLSPMTDPVCGTPIPGGPPSDLTAIAGPDNIMLAWLGADDAPEFVIYRDDVEIDRTSEHFFDDNTAEPGTEYCYFVTAQYASGESFPTNTACAMWTLTAVAAWIANEGYESLEVEWAFGGGGLCGDDMIDVLPFTGVGSTVGQGEDWPIQGGGGEDYAFSIYLPTDATINATVCMPETDFDTKMEIFTADDDCIATTTGYYNDDSTCEFSGLYSTIENAVLEQGEYYIVVGGWGGNTGNFGIEVWESGAVLGDEGDLPDESLEVRILNSIPDNVAQHNAKADVPIAIEDWDYAWNENPRTRDLTGFALTISTAGDEWVDEAVVGPDVFTYVDTGLENLTEYCYIVTAVYDEGDALPSNPACGIPTAEGLTAPIDFDVTITGGLPYATPTWSIPGGSGQDGFNVYRDAELIAELGADVFTYDDYVPEFYVDYCWYVKATYGDQESNPTEAICGQVNDPADYSVLTFDEGTVLSGEEITIDITLANVDNVAGFQFTLTDIPNMFTTIDMVTTPRTEGFSINFNEQPNGSVIVVAFDIDGGWIEVGEGPILEATLLAATVLEDTEVALEFSDVFLGDPEGNELLQFAYGNTITIVPAGATELIVEDGSAPLDGTGEFNISMTNTVPIYGFQFDYAFDPAIAELITVYTTDRTDGWMVQGGTNTIIGFSLEGAAIEPGEGPFIIVEVQGNEEGVAEICLSDIILSDANGEQLPGTGFCGAFEVLPIGECEVVFYPVGIPPTGESSLVVITDIWTADENLEIGPCDEIGVFDLAGILNSGDCETELGELLVGSGNWDGEQLDISAIGSLDYCVYGGFQYPGYVEGNPIAYKFWNEEDGLEYDVVATYSMGNGNWGDVLTAVSLEVITSIEQCVTLNPFVNNMFSFNVLPDDFSAGTVFGDDIFVAWNDGGEYYVPSFGTDQIGTLDILDGYKGFKNGPGTVDICVEGMATDGAQAITWDPFMNNVFSFLPQEEMAAEYAFGTYDDNILIIGNDAGQYYVPSLGVESLTMLYPGEAYQAFISGNNPVDFFYPEPTGGLLSNGSVAMTDEYYRSCQSEQYEIVETGISHAVIITELEGIVEVGDELVAYADGQVVGATRIVDLSQPVVIAAWGGYNEFGMELPGYTVGDEIELRLWSAAENKEMRIVSDLDSYYYGVTPLTSGTAVAYAATAIPTEYTMSQNYPNPFNPTTTIEFSVPEATNLTINIYDITGRLVRTLVDGHVEQGYQSIVWDGMDSTNNTVSAGMYIYVLQGENVSITRKMVMMK